MKKVSLVVVLVSLLMLPVVVWSQCPNLDFRYGTLANWQCYSGSCANGNYSIQLSAPIPGRIDIMSREALEKSGQLYDGQCSKIPKVPDGKQFSCRIGNSGTGAQVDGIEYEMIVDSNSSLLLLSYAWVLQRGYGSVSEHPQFNIQIRDSVGNVLGIPCGDTSFIAQNAQGAICDNGNSVAKDWTIVGFDLQPFIGKKIKIYLETRDGARSGFGYAYVVAECRPMRTELQYCNGAISARMIAPEGFSSYTWTRSSDTTWRAYTRQINVPNPVVGEIFTCTLGSELGCSTQVQIVIKQTTIVADFMFGVKGAYGNSNDVCFSCNNNQSWYDTCSRTATFVDLSQVINSKKQRIAWEILGIPVISHDSMFTYTFPDPADRGQDSMTYLVRLTVIAENGCADTSKPINHYITIYPSSKVRINGPSQICEGKTEYLVATPVQSQFTEHNWSWKKNDGSTGTYQGDTLPITMDGTYYLKSLNIDGYCHAYDSLIVAYMKPVINGLAIKDVDCWGNATGGFEHGAITGGTGIFIEATWTYWDNVNKVFIDTNVIGMVGTSVLFRNQVAGKYYFYAVDSEGCPFYDTIVIRDDPVEIKGKPYPVACNENGSIKFSATGGNPPYRFKVEKEDGTISYFTSFDSATGLTAGTYIITVTDNSKCEASDTVIVTSTIIHPTAISLSEHEMVINYINQTKLLAVAFNPTDACNQKATWRSRDENIAIVSQNGAVKAQSYGVTYVVVTSEEGGFQDSCKIIVSGVDITQLTMDNGQLTIYPNPTNGQLRIFNYELREGSVIEIYNVVGQKLLSIESLKSTETTIDIFHLARGLYFLKVGNQVARFVKE